MRQPSVRTSNSRKDVSFRVPSAHIVIAPLTSKTTVHGQGVRWLVPLIT